MGQDKQRNYIVNHEYEAKPADEKYIGEGDGNSGSESSIESSIKSSGECYSGCAELQAGNAHGDSRLELVLVRHGRTLWNMERRYLGHRDMELLPGAYEELAAFKHELAKMRFDAVFCSDLVRCRQTLRCLRPDLAGTACYDNRLREMDFGMFEGCTYEQLQFDPLYRAWIDHPSSVTPPGGESWESFEQRVRAFLRGIRESFANEHIQSLGYGEVRPIAAAPTQILIVTHGGVIRLIRSLLEAGTTFYEHQAPEPGDCVRIGFSNSIKI